MTESLILQCHTIYGVIQKPSERELSFVHLSRMGLLKLPLDLFRIKNITELWADENFLGTLPTQIAELTTLERLYLSDNELTSLPVQLGLLANLKWLYAHNNLLKSLPAEIGRLTNLERLVVGSQKEKRCVS
jgi:Leucine-rich repeat (LRR) protein